MRGKPFEGILAAVSHRNIPAYAGKTLVVPEREQEDTEHPRVCGENVARPDALGYVKGTSPRMRGKPLGRQSLNRKRRNIPAYAGKTGFHRGVGGSNTEHPRVCGENAAPTAATLGVSGTSPRMRGKLAPILGDIGALRNIPAYAGKTVLSVRVAAAMSEHPRVCGENLNSSHVCTIGGGTSPRMRGKPRPECRGCHPAGNIPAYAGKTCRPGANGRLATEHPRVCGENEAI